MINKIFYANTEHAVWITIFIFRLKPLLSLSCFGSFHQSIR